MAKIYDGCMTKNSSSTNRIFAASEKCLVPAEKCFWKGPVDIRSCGVKTRSHTKKEPTLSKRNGSVNGFSVQNCT